MSDKNCDKKTSIIPLNIQEEGDFLRLSYETKEDYFKILDELEEEFYEKNGLKEVLMLKQVDSKRYYSLREKFINKAHRNYWSSLDYPLRKLVNHIKALAEVYNNYLILDYSVRSIFLREDDGMVHCNFDSGDEDFSDCNPNLIGKSLHEFEKHLSHQKAFGGVYVESVAVDLIRKKQKSKKRKRTHVPRGLRKEVFKRDNYTCVVCGAKKEDGATLHIDHIIPVSKGGTDELDNLQTLCSDCNLNKSDVIQ